MSSPTLLLNLVTNTVTNLQSIPFNFVHHLSQNCHGKCAKTILTIAPNILTIALERFQVPALLPFVCSMHVPVFRCLTV